MTTQKQELTPNLPFISCDYPGCDAETIAYPASPSIEHTSPWSAYFIKRTKEWVHYCPEHSKNISDANELESIKAYGSEDWARKVIEARDGVQGKQSAITTCFWRLDPDAMLALGEVLAFGENKYQYQDTSLGQENWRLLKHRDHVDHALEHLVRYLKEVKDGPQANDEDAGQHLAHAFCRIMFALGSKPT